MSDANGTFNNRAVKKGFGGMPPYRPNSGTEWTEVRDLVDQLPIDVPGTPKHRESWGWLEFENVKRGNTPVVELARIAANGYSKRRGRIEGWCVETRVENGDSLAKLWVHKLKLVDNR